MKNLITFTYTKENGDVSERVLLVQVTPGNKYAGIDLSSLEPDRADEFAAKAKQLSDEYVEKLKELQNEFDLKYNYRQFFEERMSNIVRI